MKLTRYKEVAPGRFERKVYWLENAILDRNSDLMRWLRRLLKKIK